MSGASRSTLKERWQRATPDVRRRIFREVSAETETAIAAGKLTSPRSLREFMARGVDRKLTTEESK
jgi:hypothetical protein